MTMKAIVRTMGSVEFDTEEWPYLTYSLTDQSVCCFENRLGIREWGPRRKQKNHLEDYWNNSGETKPCIYWSRGSLMEEARNGCILNIC